MIEAHIKLQKIIKKEKADQLDEDFIIRFDDEILKDIDVLLKQFRKYQRLERERKDLLVQIQSAFLQRISDTPFNVAVDPDLRIKGIDPIVLPYK